MPDVEDVEKVIVETLGISAEFDHVHARRQVDIVPCGTDRARGHGLEARIPLAGA
jgi:hypothetical protein